jgi:exportin-T
LVIKQRPVQKFEIAKSGDFDSQVYLFEAVGYLISIDSIADQRKGELLTIVMTPSLLRIEEIMGLSSNPDPAIISELGDLISSVGAISKGFPDYDASEKAKLNNKIWSQPFVNTLKGILVVLSRFNMFPSIRESVRFALQRMSGCLGPELLEFIPAFLSSGLLSSESAKELIDFLPFISQMVYKFQVLYFNIAFYSQYPNQCLEAFKRKDQFLFITTCCWHR